MIRRKDWGRSVWENADDETRDELDKLERLASWAVLLFVLILALGAVLINCQGDIPQDRPTTSPPATTTMEV